jgi:hypothetical protein
MICEVPFIEHLVFPRHWARCEIHTVIVSTPQAFSWLHEVGMLRIRKKSDTPFQPLCVI